MGKYVTYLVTYSGDKLPKYYIGSTTKTKLNNGYLGSIRSKKWETIFRSEVKNNRHLFNVDILSEHNSRSEALIEEYNIQKERNVVKSDEYFNEAYANINGFFGRDVSGEVNPMYGRENEIIAINVKTGDKVRVNREEYDSNCNLSGHTLGMLTVININSGEKVRVTKEEFNKNRDSFIHHNQGFKHNGETKNKLSKMRKGMITARDWNGNFTRVNKDDERLKTGELGNTTSKRWIIIDLEGNEYKTLNFKGFFNDNNLQYPRPENIDENGIITFKRDSKKYKPTNGWIVKCLN